MSYPQYKTLGVLYCPQRGRARAFPLCCFAAIYHLIYGKAAGLRPLRSFAPLAIVSSPVRNYYRNFLLPPKGAGTLNLIANVARCPTPAIACTNRQKPKLTTTH